VKLIGFFSFVSETANVGFANQRSGSKEFDVVE
jgi:hypothetical protein